MRPKSSLLGKAAITIEFMLKVYVGIYVSFVAYRAFEENDDQFASPLKIEGEGKVRVVLISLSLCLVIVIVFTK
jgi:hypothetical protein